MGWACSGTRKILESSVMERLAETTTPNEEKHSKSLPGFIVWPFVILILYVLSVGPVEMMEDKGRISHNNPMLRIYEPLAWAYMKTPFHKPLGMYLHLWSKHFDKNGDLH